MLDELWSRTHRVRAPGERSPGVAVDVRRFG